MKTKLLELFDRYFLYAPKDLTCGFAVSDDDEETDHRLCILFEIIDMAEATGEDEFNEYPFVVQGEIMAYNPHKSFNDDPSIKPDKFSLIYDCKSYMGGVPVDHILQDSINGQSDELKKQFTTDEALTQKQTAGFGAKAGHEMEYFQFKTENAAKKFIDLLVERAGCLSIMIGFILDRPINLMGEDGWSVIKKHVMGCK